jgi:hypothetical protein
VAVSGFSFSLNILRGIGAVEILSVSPRIALPYHLAINISITEVQNGHQPAITVYVHDLNPYCLAQNLALQGSIGFLSVGLTRL